MKQITWNVLSIVAILILSGCSTSELEDNVKDPLTALGVNSARLETKSMYTGLGNTENDYTLNKVGVVVLRKDKSAYYDASVTKLVFKANSSDGTGAWVLDGSTPLYLLDAEGTVFGFAPSTETPGFLANNAPTLTVTQKAAMQFAFTSNDKSASDWDVDQTDYLYSSTQSEVKKSNTQATLTMQHAMSKISFRVMKADGLPAPGDRDFVKKVELTYERNGSDKTGFTGGTANTLDLSSGDITAVDNDRTVNLSMTPKNIVNARKVVAHAGNYDAVIPQAFGLVAPFPSEAKAKFNVKVTIGTNSSETTYDRVFTTKDATALNWEKGNHYIYTIEIADKTLSITSVTLAGWTDQAAVELPVE